MARGHARARTQKVFIHRCLFLRSLNRMCLCIIYMCICMCIYTFKYVYTYIYIYTYTYIYTYVYVYINVCICVYKCIRIYIFMYVNIDIHIFIFTHVALLMSILRLFCVGMHMMSLLRAWVNGDVLHLNNNKKEDKSKFQSGSYPRIQWVLVMLQPGQVPSPSQCQHTPLTQESYINVFVFMLPANFCYSET